MKIIYFIAIDKNVKIYLKVIFLWRKSTFSWI